MPLTTSANAAASRLTPELAAAIAAWQDWLRQAKQASDHTLAAYARDLRAFLDYLPPPVGLDTLAQLTLADFTEYCAQRAAQGRAPASIARTASTLRNFFRFLAEWQGIHNTAIQQLANPKVPRPTAPTLSASAARQTVTVAAELQDAPWLAKRDEALFALLYSAGLRLGEALALTRGQAPTGSVITVGHGRRRRCVPIEPFVITAVADYLQACPFALDAEQPLFVGARGGRLNPGVVQRQLRRLRGLLGLPAATTPQALRRCFAQRLRAEGGDLHAIRRLLGHAHLATTQRCTGPDESAQALASGNASTS